MWPWQHKSIHKKHLLWLKLSGVCLIGHTIALFVLFYIYQGNSSIHSLIICKQRNYSSPIFFVPLGQSTLQVQKQIPTHITAKPIAQIQPSQPISNPTIKPVTAIASEKNQAKTIAATKKTEPKIEPATPAKLTPEKKQPLQKTGIPEKITTNVPIPSDAYISHNYKEVEILKKTSALQKEITRTWKPPFNAKADALCDITCTITHDGSIKEILISKSSGNIMYDLSAQHAICAMTMPTWTYGKKITLTFTL